MWMFDNHSKQAGACIKRVDFTKVDYVWGEHRLRFPCPKSAAQKVGIVQVAVSPYYTQRFDSKASFAYGSHGDEEWYKTIQH